MASIGSYLFMLRFFLFLTLLFSVHIVQGQVSIGQWSSHLPASQFDWVGELQNSFLVANAHGVHKLDKRDQSINALNKINGLSGTSISCFECSIQHGVCLIGYADGNLDILSENNSIYNQRAILISTKLGDKQINGIQFIDDFAIVSTGIGVIVFDLTSSSYNVYTNVELKEQDELIQFQESFLYQDSLFFITNQGIRAIPYDQLIQRRILTWSTISTPEQAETLEHFFSDGNALYVVHKTGIFDNDTLLVKHGQEFVYSDELTGIGINSVTRKGDSLLLTQPTAVILYNTDFELQSTIFTFNNIGGMLPQSSMFASDGQVLIADLVWGGVLTTFDNQFNSTFISSSSPNSADIGNVSIIDETVYAFSSGNEFTYNLPYLHVFKDNEWHSYDMSNNELNTLRNISEIAETDDGLFFATNATGICRTDNFTTQEQFLDDNSAIQDAQPNSEYDYYGITDMVSDDDGNLWMLNNIVPEPLVVRYADGTWMSMPIGANSPKTSELLLLDNGFLVAVLIEDGIVVYDHGVTPKDISDDRFINLTSNPVQGNLPSNLVTSIAEDNDGELWIGTDAGIAVIYSPESVFEDGFEGAQRIIVSQDGYNGYLFETELVDAIAVDGADRKWVGTSNSGIFLISSDGTRQIRNFNEESSPLLSDKIVDIEVHPTTGDVFVTTLNGLISYRSDATEGKPDLEDIRIFPNPIKPGYDGQIAISNLFDETLVRITNSAGEMVHETVSLGGQATWNGEDASGQRVTSGVYLVFAVKPDGTQGKVGKILVLN